MSASVFRLQSKANERWQREDLRQERLCLIRLLEARRTPPAHRGDEWGTCTL